MSDNPLKWLLRELPAYIEPAPLTELLSRFEANKLAYARECRIRTIERRVRTLESRNYAREDAALAEWRMKLRKLKEESK